MTPRERADTIVSFIKERPHLWTEELSLEIERMITAAILADRAEREQVTDDWLAKKLQAAIKEEREACAKVCERQAEFFLTERGIDAGYDIPARNCMIAIRLRSDYE